MTTHNKLFDLRQEYIQTGLSLQQVLPNPIAQFNLWFNQAVSANLPEPNAMSLATASKNGKVSSRILLLKEVDQKGFVFFSNYGSNKGKQLDENPGAAMVFLWLALERQVRIEGNVSKIDKTESDIYFSTRPRESQLGAWASNQSSKIASRKELIDRYNQLEQQYTNKPIPRPPYWGGYRLEPIEIEFWQGRPGRLHDRIWYHKQGEQWKCERIAP